MQTNQVSATQIVSAKELMKIFGPAQQSLSYKFTIGLLAGTLGLVAKSFKIDASPITKRLFDREIGVLKLDEKVKEKEFKTISQNDINAAVTKFSNEVSLTTPESVTPFISKACTFCSSSNAAEQVVGISQLHTFINLTAQNLTHADSEFQKVNAAIQKMETIISDQVEKKSKENDYTKSLEKAALRLMNKDLQDLYTKRANLVALHQSCDSALIDFIALNKSITSGLSSGVNSSNVEVKKEAEKALAMFNAFYQPFQAA